MVAVNLQVRTAVRGDQQRIANLLYFESRIHRHLDWRAPLDWLGSPFYWVLEDGREILAVMACPQDPPGIAWIRVFACAGALDAGQAWSALWETARQEIRAAGGATVAAISLHPWFEALLLGSGFVLNQHIVMFEWDNVPIVPGSPALEIQVRQMGSSDLAAVAELDAAAFEPLWQNSLDALGQAYAQRSYATVAVQGSELIGYQLSTGSPLGAHLARLAVRPAAQSAGVGTALVRDLLMQFKHRRQPRITVNTQSDNTASQTLYERMGFVRTGEQFPVFVQSIQED